MRNIVQLPIIALVLVKKAVLQFMASGPILLLGVIAINSRFSESTWEFIEYGPATSVRVSAYIEPVKAVRERLVWNADADESDVRYVVGLWLDAYRNGELLDIFPATTADESSLGVYYQIQAARQELIYRAKKAARKRESEGEIVIAAYLYTDILELANIGKYSEFGALSSSSIVQADVLHKLIELSPELTESQHEDIVSRISGLQQPNRSIAHTMSRVSVVYRADLARQGKPTAIIAAARSSRTHASAADRDLFRIDEWRQLSDADSSFAPLYTLSRLAHYQQVKFIEANEQAISALTAEPDQPVS